MDSTTKPSLRRGHCLTQVNRLQRRLSEAWKVVNEISGQKKSVRGQIAASGPEERVSNWFNHFNNLLGSSGDVAGTEQNIPEIICDLYIDDGPLSTKEYGQAKKSLKLGKSAGPDNIPPEVYKFCNPDDILYLCNLSLMNNHKLDQWSLVLNQETSQTLIIPEE